MGEEMIESAQTARDTQEVIHQANELAEASK